MKKRLLALLFVATTLVSCDVAKQQASGMYNLVNCKYSYNSISNLTVSGMNLSSGLSLAYIPKISSLLSGKATSMPVDFTVNLDVKNPNKGAALLSGLDYVISIDEIPFTNGSVNQSLNIGAGQTQILPLTIGVDLMTLMNKHSKEAVTDMAKNFIGMGDRKSNVSIQLRPTFNVGGTKVTSPVAIPVSFSFGGKRRG